MSEKVLIVIPVYNEKEILERNVLKVLDYYKKNLSEKFEIIIADNASNDGTSEIASKLASIYPEIKHLRLEQKGKGLAIKKAWQNFSGEFYVFIDADLSTDLSALKKLIKILKSREADLVIGSRYHKESKIERSIFRSFLSFCYNFLIRLLFGLAIHDMANGFKGVNKEIVEKILPLVKNDKWFFDTELTLLSFLSGYKIKEIPIIWKESTERKSHVNTLKTSYEYLKELIKLKMRSKKLKI